MKTQELKLRVRKESLRKKIRQAETETQYPELVEEFEAKRDLRRVSIVSVPGSHKHCFLEGVKRICLCMC